MTKIDQIIADALAGSPETHVAILAREVVRLREAPAVIPPLTDDEIEERYRSLTNGTDELEREWCYKDCRWAYSLAVYRVRVAIAGNMLGIGMVAVDAARLAALESIAAKIEALALGPDGCAWTPLHYREFARGELRAALRANQGGV